MRVGKKTAFLKAGINILVDDFLKNGIIRKKIVEL